jgi:hypothetical protein
MDADQNISVSDTGKFIARILQNPAVSCIGYGCDSHRILQLTYSDIFICLTAGFDQGYLLDTSRYSAGYVRIFVGYVADPFQYHFSTISIGIELPHAQQLI